MEAESAVKQIPGLGARSHGVRFLATTPTRGDAILMVPRLLPPSPVKEQLVAIRQLICYDGSLRLVELCLPLGRSCL